LHLDLSDATEPAAKSVVAPPEAFLAAIVESADDSIVATDLEGTILAWNRGSERLWGYSVEEAIGKPITILFPEGRRQHYQDNIEIIRRHGSKERFEVVRVRKDGTAIDVSVIMSAVKDSTGRLCGISAIYRDITHRKRAEAELLRAKEIAEAANRAKSEFLANISHEIRTPMNGILGMLEVALDMGLPDELRDYLETARASAGALLVILNDVLDFSKIEADRMQLEETAFSVPGLAAEALKSLAAVAAKKGLELRQDIAAEMPPVLLGDPTRLRQVLVNLLNNAIKFTERGFVAVTANVECVEAEAAVVRFCVSDSGIGISADQQRVIFEAFRQGDGSTTRRYGGTGLGLSISLRLVRMMGGELSVDSQVGIGSTFSFTARLRRTT
jgi:two-component system, sensor histidine kinase and response regulator